jgi:hypothetical protein
MRFKHRAILTSCHREVSEDLYPEEGVQEDDYQLQFFRARFII